MKILIEIPEEFERDFNIDRFEDILTRISYEADNVIRYDVGYNPITSKYDIEVLEMLIQKLKKANVIQEDIL